MTCKINVRLSRVRGVQYAHPVGELGGELLALLRVRRLSMELVGQVQRFGIEFEVMPEPLSVPVLRAPGVEVAAKDMTDDERKARRAETVRELNEMVERQTGKKGTLTA